MELLHHLAVGFTTALSPQNPPTPSVVLGSTPIGVLPGLGPIATSRGCCGVAERLRSTRRH